MALIIEKIGNLENGIDDKKLADFLSKSDIIVDPYSNYFIGGNKKNGLVMGYSSVNNKLIKETISRMKQEYEAFLNQWTHWHVNLKLLTAVYDVL